VLKPTIGSVVGGKYKVVRAIGEGGMGSVYEAEHLLTLRHVALKWVHPQTGSSDHARDRLLHEARATSRIRHRNVVDVYDVLQDGDAVCLVMQLLVGEPLSELIARETLPLEEFIGLLLPVMRGVAAAHAAGVVHRDIKPENIILARESGHRIPKLIDFGISKVFDRQGPDLTRSGITMGTPKYVSYEQLLGAREVDARTDVYSFGVMLYEAIGGEPPYRASSFGEQAVAFATSVPRPLHVLRPELPSELALVVEQAIAKERSERIPDMRRFIELLEPFAEVTSYAAPLHSFPATPRPQATTVDIGPASRPEPEPELEPALPPPWSEPSSSPRPHPPGGRPKRARLVLYAFALLGGSAVALHVLREPVPAPSTAHAASREEPPQLSHTSAGVAPAREPEHSNQETTLSAHALEPKAVASDAGASAPRADARTQGRSERPPAPTISRPPRRPRPKHAGAPVGRALSTPSDLELAKPAQAEPSDPLSTHRAGRLARDEF
jgi:serine/threonine-protein kinase